MSVDLFETVLQHDELAELSPPARREALAELVAMAGGTQADLRRMVDRIDGYGPLTDLMNDGSVTDILVDGPERVWIERNGQLEPTDVSFNSDELTHLIHRLTGEANVRVDMSHPLADARLADGSRLHVVLPPVSERPVVSIRRFATTPLSLEDLLDRQALTEEQADRLRTAVEERCSVLVSGATGSGKTTLLGALLALVLPSERIVTIEETRELRVEHLNVVSLAGRAPNPEGVGCISLADLVRASLRMRPDRIVVGEVRGEEAWHALSALTTGHAGSMMTIHAPDAAGAIDRFTSLAHAARGSAPYEVIAGQVASTIDVVVHIERLEGRRRVAEILTR